MVGMLLAGLALVASACAEESPAPADAGAAGELAAPVAEVAPTSTAPAATTTMAEDMAHHDDDEMATHADEATDDNADHDESADHDDDEADHDEGAAHEDDAAADHDEGETGDFDREVEVVMSEFAFEPASLNVQAGETVRFVLVNQGAVPHEFRLTTAHAAAEHVASGHEGHGDEGAEGGHGHDEVIVEVAGGATDSVTVTFHEGGEFDQFACLIPGHYEAGMFGELTVAG